MNKQILKQIGFGLGVVILQVIFFRHLKVFNIQPDCVLIFLLWIITKQNRTSAIITAAVLGFTQDAFLDIWGLNMFAKTLLVFIAYNPIVKNMNTRVQLPRTLSIVLLASLAHNLILLTLSSLVANYTAELLFWRKWIGNSMYTTVVAGVVQLFRTK